MRSIFRLGSRLAELHESNAGGSLAVIPVVVDDLACALPILEALRSAYNGRLFNAADPALWAPVPATQDPIRFSSIQAALAHPPDPRDRKVLVEKTGDTVDAFFEGRTTRASISDGERTFCSVVRALLHRGLDDRTLGVVAYRDAEMDWRLRQSIWNLPARFLRDLPTTSPLQTLIVVVETSISVGVHCHAETGFRMAVTGSRLVQRNGPDDLRNEVRRIIHDRRPIVFFLGAGFSASSGLPMGNSLRDDAIRGLIGRPGLDDDTTSEQLARRFREWMDNKRLLSDKDRSVPAGEYVRKLTLEQVVRAEKMFRPDLPTLRQFHDMQDAIQKPGSAVTDLALALEHLVGRVIIVEVNFDRLVERFCTVPYRVFFTDQHFKTAPAHVKDYLAGRTKEIPILKVHGSIEDLESCVASEEQTKRGIGPRKLSALRAVVGNGCQWIYVGASMRDHDLVPVLLNDDVLKRIDERWVTPYLDASVEEFGMERLPAWLDSQSPAKTVEQRTISETADVFFRTLKQELVDPV